MSHQKSSDTFTRKASSVSFGILISRIFGYARDMFIANFFGATLIADAFFVAYKIPNLLRRLLGEGSLSTSFIPVYTEYITTKSEEDSRSFVNAVLGAFIILFIILTAVGIIFAPQIVFLIAPGFRNNPEQVTLTILLTRIMFPFLMAIGLGAITLGILNSWRMFLIPAIAPVMLSISQIFFILLVSPFLKLPISGLAIGVVVGGFLQLLIQIIAIWKKSGGFLPAINFRHPGLKKVLTLMLPAAVGIGIVQINSFVDTICATLLREGSVTHLYYGNRLMQLPLAIFATAIATVSLPLMSENVAKNQFHKLEKTFSFSLRAISFLILPASVGLIMLSNPIIKLLFERGEFMPSDTAATAFVLVCYSVGLIFYSGVKVSVSAFHSMQDTKTPVIIASLAMILNIALNITVVSVGFIREMFGAGGLALATAISAFVNFIFLIIIFKKRNGITGGREIIESALKHIVATVFLGLFLYYGLIYTESWTVFLKTPILIIGGIFVYYIMAELLSIKELKQLKKVIGL